MRPELAPVMNTVTDLRSIGVFGVSGTLGTQVASGLPNFVQRHLKKLLKERFEPEMTTVQKSRPAARIERPRGADLLSRSLLNKRTAFFPSEYFRS
jgi:hypothetical protein